MQRDGINMLPDLVYAGQSVKFYWSQTIWVHSFEQNSDDILDYILNIASHFVLVIPGLVAKLLAIVACNEGDDNF